MTTTEVTETRVTETSKNEVANPSDVAAWGDGMSMSTQDTVIPKVSAMQGLSPLVVDGKAVMGEFRDSVDGVLLGGLDKPVHLIPFLMEKTWVEFDMVVLDGDLERKFKGEIPITADNENLPWKDEANNIERDYNYNLYCLLPEHVKKGTDMVHVVSLRRTSRRTGAELSTLMYTRNKKAGLPPCHYTILLSGKKISKGTKTYVVMGATKDRPITEKEGALAFEWFKTIKAGGHKVDTSEFTESTGPKYQEGETEKF